MDLIFDLINPSRTLGIDSQLPLNPSAHPASRPRSASYPAWTLRGALWTLTVSPLFSLESYKRFWAGNPELGFQFCPRLHCFGSPFPSLA